MSERLALRCTFIGPRIADSLALHLAWLINQVHTQLRTYSFWLVLWHFVDKSDSG